MRLSRIWKLYLIYTTLLVMGMILAGFILNAAIKERLETDLIDDVLVFSKLIAKAMPETEDFSVLDPFCRDYQKAAGVRITIIKTDGKVIGESERKSITINNHLGRPEVRASIKDGVGTAIRYSDTLNMDMLYVAIFLKEKSRVLRLALPMEEVRNIENEVMLLFSFILYSIPILAIIISFLFAKFMYSGKIED